MWGAAGYVSQHSRRVEPFRSSWWVLLAAQPSKRPTPPAKLPELPAREETEYGDRSERVAALGGLVHRAYGRLSDLARELS
jgi:hypothetical protein